MNNLLRIPNNNEFKESIKRWAHIDWKRITKSETEDYILQIKAQLIGLYGIFPRFHNYSNTEILNNNLYNFRKVYRVREYNENINESLIEEFSNKPVNAPKSLGRADFPYYPVFYGSPYPGIALLETIETNNKVFDSTKDNVFYLAEWILKEFTPLNIMRFTFGKYDPEHDLSLFSKYYVEDLYKSLDANTNEEKSKINDMMQSIGDLFCQDEYSCLSACMADIHLYNEDSDRCELFIYPSARSNKGNLNYAIHPNTVIHKMFLQRVYKIKLNDFMRSEKKKLIFTFDSLQNIRCGKNDLNGKLRWDQCSESDIEKFKTLFPPIPHDF